MKIITAANYKEKNNDLGDVQLRDAVRKIIADVKEKGDKALFKFTKQFDRVELDSLIVSDEEIEQAFLMIDDELKQAIELSIENTTIFAEAQMLQFKDLTKEIKPGVWAGQKVAPIQKAGVYVPGGKFPLPSSAVMGITPAKIAGVKQISLFSPPTYKNSIHPAILVAASLAGATDIYKIGGVQAIAAAAYGTESIPSVDIVVGPGNKYVTEAKKQVFGKVGIDFLAGPSEILIVADETASARLIASDLLAQAEHDENAIPILVTPDKILAEEVCREVDQQLNDLSTKVTAAASIENNGLVIIANNLIEAVVFANQIAPEHLEIQTKNPEFWASQCHNFGSIFIGENSVEALGDYVAGINHVLPTLGCARYTAGLSVMNFVRLQTSLKVSKRGMNIIGSAACKIADAEGLFAHRNSVLNRM